MNPQQGMSNSIRVLPRELAEKIAAGEVIERPGSVVKELVENALDAGATQIRIEFEDGGKKRLTIRDNGCGIADGEVLTALERHATSKIQALDDLWNLDTMGFRGEALPSIAAISRFTLRTRAAGTTNRGRDVYLEGGTLLRDESLLELDPGTSISVEDLFYNVPARLKFQRARSGESAYIREMIEHFALTHPAVSFALFSENRKLLELAPCARPERVARIFGTASENLENFESRFEDTAVEGFLDRDARVTNSRQIYLAVNRRIVKDRLLQQAVLTALRPRMMEGEYPRIFLSLEIPRGDVDVNVHPTKSEVRFRRSRDVFQIVHGALSKLAGTVSRPFYSAPTPTPQTFAAQAAPSSTPLFEASKFGFRTKTDAPASWGAHETAFKTLTASETVNRQPITDLFSSLQYLGQLKNTYLLFQDGEGLVLIDQHAAHERVNYERIRADFLKTGLTPRPLLVSITVRCKPDDILTVDENRATFEKLGLEVEPFGDESLLLRAIPQGLDPAKAQELFRTLLEQLKETPAGESLAADPSRLSPKLERMLSTAACHASVRAGQPLSPQQARALAAQMDATPASLNCPHGRPASIRLTFAQIENLFKR